jgi:release factor glutamine methyltransferase
VNDLKAQVKARLVAAGIAQADAESERIVQAAESDPRSDVRALEMADARASGKPLPYVTGRELFMGVELLADPGALVPRKETEILGHGALRRLKDAAAVRLGQPLHVIDMCCGAGNLACALAIHLPQARVWASDLTDGCVSLARRNAERLGLRDRVHVAQGDLFAGLAGLALEGTMDAVVCNPPYISTGKLESERAPLLEQEPREAFDGGPYGLSIHQRVIKDALPYLKPGAWLMFEFGLGQHRQLELLFKRARVYEPVVFENDGDDNPRASFTRKKAE